jgi:hypothetical protein
VRQVPALKSPERPSEPIFVTRKCQTSGKKRRNGPPVVGQGSFRGTFLPQLCAMSGKTTPQGLPHGLGGALLPPMYLMPGKQLLRVGGGGSGGVVPPPIRRMPGKQLLRVGGDSSGGAVSPPIRRMPGRQLLRVGGDSSGGAALQLIYLMPNRACPGRVAGPWPPLLEYVPDVESQCLGEGVSRQVEQRHANECRDDPAQLIDMGCDPGSPLGENSALP